MPPRAPSFSRAVALAAAIPARPVGGPRLLGAAGDPTPDHPRRLRRALPLARSRLRPVHGQAARAPAVGVQAPAQRGAARGHLRPRRPHPAAGQEVALGDEGGDDDDDDDSKDDRALGPRHRPPLCVRPPHPQRAVQTVVAGEAPGLPDLEEHLEGRDAEGGGPPGPRAGQHLQPQPDAGCQGGARTAAEVHRGRREREVILVDGEFKKSELIAKVGGTFYLPDTYGDTRLLEPRALTHTLSV